MGARIKGAVRDFLARRTNPQGSTSCRELPFSQISSTDLLNQGHALRATPSDEDILPDDICHEEGDGVFDLIREQTHGFDVSSLDVPSEDCRRKRHCLPEDADRDDDQFEERDNFHATTGEFPTDMLEPDEELVELAVWAGDRLVAGERVTDD